MTCCSQRLFPWAVCLLVLLPPPFDSAGPRDDQPVIAHQALLRSKRNSCQDGIYTVKGKTCCLCAAGQFLKKHCNVTAEDRECVFCETERTYNDHANNKSTCELCKSCAHLSGNQEVREACTIGKNTVCGCIEGHYYDSPVSAICNPCDTCEGKVVKTPCRGTNDTVCEEKNQGHVSVLVGVLVGVSVFVGVVLIALLVCGVCWKKQILCFRKSREPVAGSPEGHANVQEMEELLKDLSPHVPAVAEVVGWPEMRDIAMATGTTAVTIDNCRRDNPGDGREQTVQLLLQWVEAQGGRASAVLVEQLRTRHRTATVEQVLAILRRDG